MKFLSSISKFWCRSLELAVSVGRSSSENEFQTAKGLMKHEGMPCFPLAFLFGHLTFHPAALPCLWKLVLRLPSKSQCSFGIFIFCIIPCARHFVNYQIFAVYWWTLRPPKWFMLLEMLHHPEEGKKVICLKLVQLSVDEIFDCLIDQEYSNHL